MHYLGGAIRFLVGLLYCYGRNPQARADQSLIISCKRPSDSRQIAECFVFFGLETWSAESWHVGLWILFNGSSWVADLVCRSVSWNLETSRPDKTNDVSSAVLPNLIIIFYLSISGLSRERSMLGKVFLMTNCQQSEKSRENFIHFAVAKKWLKLVDRSLYVRPGDSSWKSISRRCMVHVGEQ